MKANKTATVAFLHPMDGLNGDDRAISEQLWAKTTELLTPALGKFYTRFEPAVDAWGLPVNTPYGVVLGRSDPRKFLVCYIKAHEKQDESVKFHMGGFLSGFEIGNSFGEGNVQGFQLNPKENAGPDVSSHLSWHLGMMAGEPFPDAGLYYVPARQAVINESLERQVLSSVGSYALCMVCFHGDDSYV